MVVGVGDLELDVFAGAGDDDDGLVPVAAVFLLATEAVVLPPPDDVDVLATVRLGPEYERPVEGELEPAVRLLATDSVVDLVDGVWLERLLDVGLFPALVDGIEALTTDTTVAVDAFMEGATVTTPTVVVAIPVAVEWVEVVIAARAAIAPDPLTEVEDVAEDLEVVVAPDVVDLITGATTAVTTVAVVLEVLDPNPLPEPTEFKAVFPTAATTDVDVPTTDKPNTLEPAAVVVDLDDCPTVGPAADDCKMLDKTTDVLTAV